MSIYDTLLANQQQGLQTQNANQMQIAQMPTFADKFLAGLRGGQQAGMQTQMNMAQLQHLSAQNQNYKDQRINQEMAAAGKYATPENAAQFSGRIQDLGGPTIDFSQGGSEHQKRVLQTKIAGDKNQIASDLAGLKKALNEAQIKKMDSQIPLIEAQIRNLESKSDALDSKSEIMMGGDNPLMAQYVQSQIWRNMNPTPTLPSNPGVIRATTDLNKTAQAQAMKTLSSSWVMKTPADRTQILLEQGVDPGTAKVLSLSPTLPTDHPSIQGILQKQIEVERKRLQAPATSDTATDTTE